MSAKDGGSSAYGIAAALAALVPFIQMTMLGGNSQLLQAVAPPLNFALCFLIVPLIRPDVAFWRTTGPVIALLLAALVWAILPELLGPDHLPGYPLRALPDLLLPNVLRFLGGIAALLAGAMIGYRRGAIGRAMPWLILFGTLNLAVGLMARADDPYRVWGFGKTIHQDRFTGTLLNGNAAGAVFGLVAVLAVGQALALFGRMQFGDSRRTWIGFALTVLSAISCLLACVITASRSALILTLAAILLLMVMARVSATRRKVGWPWLAGMVVIVMGAAWIGGSMGLLVMDRFAKTGSDSFDRMEIWQHYWALANAAPTFGYGLGSFTDTNVAHLTTVRDAVFLSYIHAAHNQALQLALAGGWPFLLLQVAAGGLILVGALQTYRPGFDPRARAIWLGLLIVLACSMVDIALTVPAVVTLCALLLGLLWGRAIRRKVKLGRARKPIRADRLQDFEES